MDVTQRFGLAVRRIRLRQNLSQEQLAEKAHLHQTSIGAVERAQRNSTLLNAERIAEALGVSLTKCLQEADEFRRTRK